MLHRILRGGNSSSLSNLNPENKRRDLVLLSALIEYPGIGLILFETGCAEDLDVVCLPYYLFYILKWLCFHENKIKSPNTGYIEMGRPPNRRLPPSQIHRKQQTPCGHKIQGPRY